MLDTFPLLRKTDFPSLRRDRPTTLQANLGYHCNQACLHCHVAASPKRTETMSWETMEILLDFAARQGIRQFDLTGGAPELNPNFRRLVQAARAQGIAVIDRCNLTILSEPGRKTWPPFSPGSRSRSSPRCLAIWKKMSTGNAAMASLKRAWPDCAS